MNNWERSLSSNLIAQLKALEQKHEITPTKSKQKEIIKLAAEINKIGTKERNTKNKTMKQEAGSLRKSVKLTNP